MTDINSTIDRALDQYLQDKKHLTSFLTDENAVIRALARAVVAKNRGAHLYKNPEPDTPCLVNSRFPDRPANATHYTLRRYRKYDFVRFYKRESGTWYVWKDETSLWHATKIAAKELTPLPFDEE